MTVQTGAPKIDVVFPRGRGVPRWRERQAQSPVPNAWPYGLDQLAGGRAVIRDLEVPPLGRAAQWRAELLGVRRRPGSGTTLCWDEATAVRMATTVPAARMFAGVIWVTDAVAEHGRTRESTLIRRALRTMDGLWVLSRPQVPAVQEWLGADCPPVHFLRFGVDAEFYAAAPWPERPIVVSIGGDRDRDTATLYAALEQVLHEHPDLECVVQTSSTLRPPTGVRKESFIPHDEVRRLYARASAVIIPTRPNLHVSGMTVGLEAMSVGRPVVASATPGMSDYVEDGVTGRLVAPGDSDAFAAAVLDLLADPAAAEAMGAAGRAAVRDRHTTATMCHDLLEIVGDG